MYKFLITLLIFSSVINIFQTIIISNNNKIILSAKDALKTDIQKVKESALIVENDAIIEQIKKLLFEKLFPFRHGKLCIERNSQMGKEN